MVFLKSFSSGCQYECLIGKMFNVVTIIGVSPSEPYTSETFVLMTIHKNLQIKIGEPTNASIFVCVMVHDKVNLTG